MSELESIAQTGPTAAEAGALSSSAMQAVSAVNRAKRQVIGLISLVTVKTAIGVRRRVLIGPPSGWRAYSAWRQRRGGARAS